jgi:hypothetical protein
MNGGGKMTFRSGQKKYQTVFFLGVLCLLLFNLWPRFLHLTFDLGEDWVDGLRGLLLGLAVGLTGLAVRLKGRRQRCGGDESGHRAN